MERPVAPGQPPMVGIGASAGGLDAFLRLLRRVPADSGFAYLLVQHLDPDHESLLPNLIGRVAAIPVVHAEDGMRIDANHAYVIPPNTTMTVAEGHLHLAVRPKARGAHMSVDAFLCSLAAVHGSAAVGIILSGAGTDGAQGIEAIKEAGGITFAQDPATASYASMPEHAIATGCVDFVLTAEEIAQQLTQLGRHVARQPILETAPIGSAENGEDEALRRILVLLHQHTGVDFQRYRPGTVHRRILRRMLVHQQESRRDYLAHLRANPAELDLLYLDLLIGVTSFFRDPEVFETLRSSVLPEIMRGHRRNTPIRAWVAGCASGEEAYSMAIILLEFLEGASIDLPVQIFGTDLSEPALAKARSGVYPASIELQVSPERLRRFFIPDQGGYRVTKRVRDLCVFSRQNVTRDPPFSRLDLVSCRNVLIYLDLELQRRVFPMFHFALEPHGVLVLGSAESSAMASELFVPLSKRHKIFRPATAAPSLHLEVDDGERENPRPGPRAAAAPVGGTLPVSRVPTDLLSEAERLLLGRFVPPGVVVDDQLEIRHFLGRTTDYLSHGPGIASLQLLQLSRAELVEPIRSAIVRARLENRAVREQNIVLREGSGVRDVAVEVTVEVIPFQPTSTPGRFSLVLFEEQPRSLPHTPSDEVEDAEGSDRARPNEGDVTQALRADLDATKRYLQAVSEEHEATIEELRSANEEIQSGNEELQSTNEELQTAKEEVQSTNEELVTVNEELQHRNRELMTLASDLANVFSSTHIPIVLVGRDLRLRRFTPASSQVMRVIATDVGRPLDDIKLRFSLPDLERRVTSAFDTLQVSEQEFRDEEGRWWSLAVRPYQTIDRQIDGAVLVFTDIDASKRYGEKAEEASEARRQLLVTSEEARIVAEEARGIAEKANEAKSTFLASMSHDLRTPLNAIAGYTDLLEMGLRGPVTAEQGVDLARIKRSSQHLMALINDILNFAKLEVGHEDVRSSAVEVAPVIAELEDLILPQLSTAGLLFEIGQTSAVVDTDPEKLRQLLLNLLSNAIKFTPPPGRVGVDVEHTDGVVHIVVWDTGVGIALDEQARIFEPFVQLGRGSTSPGPGGVGLGLAISRHLARVLHGDLTVESSPGQGSRFVLTLPASASRGDGSTAS